MILLDLERAKRVNIYEHMNKICLLSRITLFWLHWRSGWHAFFTYFYFRRFHTEIDTLAAGDADYRWFSCFAGLRIFGRRRFKSLADVTLNTIINDVYRVDFSWGSWQSLHIFHKDMRFSGFQRYELISRSPRSDLALIYDAFYRSTTFSVLRFRDLFCFSILHFTAPATSGQFDGFTIRHLVAE